jgi:hypothetical protein
MTLAAGLRSPVPVDGPSNPYCNKHYPGGSMKSLMVTTALSALLTLGLAPAALADIKIGASISATGPAAFLGDPEAKDPEDAGRGDQRGRAASTARRSNLIVYDDNGDPNKARTFATRLVEDDEVVADHRRHDHRHHHVHSRRRRGRGSPVHLAGGAPSISSSR